MGKIKSSPPSQLTPPANEVSHLVTLFNTGHHVELENRVRLLLEQYPDSGIAWKLFGLTLHMQGKEALPALQKAVELLPDDAEAHGNLAAVLRIFGKLDDAVASGRRAVQINPNFAHAHNNLGVALKDLRQLNEAAASYRRAIKIKPDFAVAYNNLGAALQDLGQLVDAVECFRQAVKIKPDFSEAHNNLGGNLNDLGQTDAAVASYHRALSIRPDFADAYSSLLFTLSYTASRSPSEYLAEARQYGQMVARKVTSRFIGWQCADQPERLRVGIVSSDLHAHPVGYFLESLLAHIDPARIELIAYPTDPEADQLTTRIKPYFTAWKPLFSLNDQAAAQLIHADGVHILLDLSGHSGKNRLPMFAWKPAPVQVSWLGYFASTGMAEIDYLLADQVGVTEAQRKYFSETVWYLPDTRLCFSPPEIDLPVANLPALKNGHITFGCFQKLGKVEDAALAAWASILTALPSARLRWQCKQLQDPAVAEQVIQRLQRHGISPTRVALHGGVSREAYLAAHAEVDFQLDTFPYPGGTTTCEALWMGVPTLTLAGDTLLSRQGASLLTAAGLENWIATSLADYIDKAVAMSSDLSKLAALRAGLRDQVKTSPLFDAPRFARNLEDALWGMWQSRQT